MVSGGFGKLYLLQSNSKLLREGIDLETLQALREYLPFLIPLALIQCGLMVASLVHVLRHDTYRFGSRPLWIVLCLVVSIIGPVLYFAIGKGEDV